MGRRIIKDLLTEALVGFYVLAVVIFCWPDPMTLALLLGGGLAAMLWIWEDKADVATMAAAAVIGPTAEYVSVRNGVWTYFGPGLIMGLPFWLPLVWAFLFCLFRHMSITGLDIVSLVWPDQKQRPRRIAYILLGLIVVGYSIFTLIEIRRSIAIIYSIFLILSLVFWRKERDVLVFIIAGILGTMGEYISIRQGFWVYHFPYFRQIGLPLSLPLAWGLTAVIVTNIARWWEKPESRKSSQPEANTMVDEEAVSSD